MIDKRDLEERLDFLSFSEDDRAALEQLRPLLEQHADRIVGDFYRHLLSFDSTRQLLRDPDVKDRLLVKQREYVLSLAGPHPNDDYVLDRLRIGRTHERIGLEPQWYLGAYSLYLSMLVPLIHQLHADRPVEADRAVTSLMKLLMFDAQLAMQAYIEVRERRLEYLNQELAELSRTLKQEVEQTGEELRETTQRARAAEELASTATLVAGLAHEIGTPMNVIQGHAELLESSVTEEHDRKRLAVIRQQIERISNIIKALLHAARPHPPSMVQLRLDELLDTTLDFVREKLSGRAIEIERDYDGVPEVRADGDKLQQLFLNLFLNAADAMPSGGRLRVQLRPGRDDYVEIRIRDTGTGMSPEERERIFEPFYTSKPAGQGNGLGLVVARSIVLDHGGEIDVESREGAGTEFRIELPVGDG